MEKIIALCIGVLYAGGIFLILQRSLVRLIIGIIMLGNGANLLIFLLGRISKGTPPIIPNDSNLIAGAYSDPIPQALILTAIVISFGLQAFAIILIKRAYRVVKTDDLMQFDTKEF
jgi:multicomponent Na+:H+ antiporter subunit C